jgi:hypothetical protein
MNLNGETTLERHCLILWFHFTLTETFDRHFALIDLAWKPLKIFVQRADASQPRGWRTFKSKHTPMKRLPIVVSIGLVLAMWSIPLACLARTLTVVNETNFSIVFKIQYAACRSDNAALASGQTWKINAGGCPVSSVDVRLTDGKVRQSTLAIACSRPPGPPRALPS